METDLVEGDLADLGSVTEQTKGFWPSGFLYDGGAGYYYCSDVCGP